MIKKILIYFVLAFFSPTVFCAWTLIYENPEKEAKYYVDLDALVKRKNAIRMMTLEDFKAPVIIKKNSYKLSYNSIRSFSEFDCGQKKMRILSYSVYPSQMGNGDPLMSKGAHFDWVPVKSNTLNEAYLQIACQEGQ